MKPSSRHTGTHPPPAVLAYGSRGLVLRTSCLVLLILAYALASTAQTGPAQVPGTCNAGNDIGYREQVLIHTDQSWYVTGEMVWCSIYLTDARTQHLSMLSRVVYLELVDPKGKPAWQAMVRIDSGRGQASWKVPSSLPTGGYILRSYTRWMRNHPVECFFQVPLLLVNPQKKPDTGIQWGYAAGTGMPGQPRFQTGPSSASLSVRTDARRYGLRKAVTVTVQATDSGGKPVAATFSASVTRVGDIHGVAVEDSTHQKVSANSTQTGNPDAYDRPLAAGQDSAAQRKTLWNQTDHPRYIPELAGPLASVLVQHKRTGKPVPGTLVSLSVPGTRFQTVIARSNAEGVAIFPLEQREGSGVLAYAFLDQSQDSLLLAPLPMTDARTSPPLRVPVASPEAFRGAIEAMLPEIQLSQAFQQTSQGPMYVRQDDDTTAFFGKADREYLLDDYVRFATMEEVLREFIREVEVRKSKSDYRLRVLNAPLRSFFEDDPLVLLDGVPIRDMNRVMRLDPLRLRSIAIVTRRYYLGGQGFAGILVLRTYGGDLGGTELPEDILITEYGGLLPSYDFVSPDHTQHPGERIPDLRRTLFWTPLEKSGTAEPARLRFHTGDVPGRYMIIVHALTGDGRHVQHTAFFEVR